MHSLPANWKLQSAQTISNPARTLTLASKRWQCKRKSENVSLFSVGNTPTMEQTSRSCPVSLHTELSPRTEKFGGAYWSTRKKVPRDVYRLRSILSPV